jgi:hypothetical protein
MLDRHKQKMADGEQNMDEWNKSIDIDVQSFVWKSYILDNQVPKPYPHVQVYQKQVAGNHNLRPTSG